RLRYRHHGCSHAAHGWADRAEGNAIDPSEHHRSDHHGAWFTEDRDRGDRSRRLRLLLQTVRRERSAHRYSPRCRAHEIDERLGNDEGTIAFALFLRKTGGPILRHARRV